MQIFLYRILGNETPPRDVAGGRLAALDNILRVERGLKYNSPAAAVRVVWVLNAVIDPALEQQYLDRLVGHQVVRRPISQKAFDRSLPFERRIRWAIDINGARNDCLRWSRKLATEPLKNVWTFALDGECCFLKSDWERLVAGISRNQAGASPVKHISLPMYRVQYGDGLTPLEKRPAEPQVGFRGDSTVWFNEELEFGNNEKQELLYRLGHSRIPNNSHILLPEATDCIQLSLCRHFSTGDDRVETNVFDRIKLRRESLKNLLKRIDAVGGVGLESL